MKRHAPGHGAIRSRDGRARRVRATGATCASWLLALAITLSIVTGLPPWRLLSSAASMKAKISIVSSALTGGLPVLKNLTISTTNGS